MLVADSVNSKSIFATCNLFILQGACRCVQLMTLGFRSYNQNFNLSMESSSKQKLVNKMVFLDQFCREANNKFLSTVLFRGSGCSKLISLGLRGP